MASPFAFVTLISSDSYLPGALAQVAAIRDIHPSPPQHPEVAFQTVCIVTPESLDVATIKRLRQEFDLVVGVEILEQENQQGLKLLGRPDLTTVLTKLHIFRLVQFQKIIFLDADVLPIRPISHLFNLPHDFSAAPDVGWPDIFNSGVLVVTPGNDKFAELNELIKTRPSWDGGDQGLLNEWRGENWNRLSFTYNTTPTAAYTYAPAYERYGSQISALHFIGSNKPWKTLAYRPPFATRQSEPSDSVQRAYDYDSLVDRWYDVYDRHYRTHTPTSEAPFEVKTYTSAWDQPSDSGRAPPAQTYDLDALKRLALAGLNASTPDTHPGEGIYQSMPLEGRIDLMRSRKPASDERETTKPKPNLPPVPYFQLPIDDWDRFPSDSFSFDEGISTPLGRPSTLEGGPRWQTLPTPGPNEVPNGPRMGMVPLPHTPTPLPGLARTASDFYASESESESLLLTRQYSRPPSRPSSRPPSRPSSVNGHRYDHHHQHSTNQGDSPNTQHYHHSHADEERRGDKANIQHGHHHHHHYHHLSQGHRSQVLSNPLHNIQHIQAEAEKRPLSPPLVPWNPAVELPPNTMPHHSAFPVDAYFANVWDQTPSRHHDFSPLRTSPKDSSGLFEAPPAPSIPLSLLQQGHYRNITGDSQTVTPSPDRQKVKNVFPWEEKPRPLPGRVFPDSDAPSSSHFLSPGSQSQTSTTTPTTPETRPNGRSRASSLSPLYMANTLTFANAWDTVPSIQKYATKLVKPPPPLPPLAPAFDDDSYRKGRRRSRDDRSQVSRDGDDEDNADDEDEGEPEIASSTKWDDEDADHEKAERRSRSGSIINASLKPKKKRYKDQGVQTPLIEKRSYGIQADLSKAEKHQKKPSMTGKRHLPVSTNGLSSPAPTRDTGVGGGIDSPPNGFFAPQPDRRKKSSDSSPASHSPLRLSREFISPPPGIPANGDWKSPSPPLLKPGMRTMSSATIMPASPAYSPLPSGPVRSRASSLRSSPTLIRQGSNDSSLGSPASSYGPLSPADSNATLPYIRKGGRVWDPARGVELFKKGSEEVLARFLKMGSFDEEAR
ncbi:hypothetical protein CPB83DRAFT_913069 [Crepidotus variabilis]|uniref:glycogenin glucosyltransferase n=1 Tax=Crepidotus variabilis TaxID=179855 RepID=A0A9P6EVG0_9AGAR|nr:hypothetical protein CPB83DRAFT_913069 [Crepidotus variabilis]